MNEYVATAPRTAGDEAGAASDALDCTGLEAGEVAAIVNAFVSAVTP